MATKLTRLAHKIEIQLHLVAGSCTICSSHSRRPVRKLLVTPSHSELCIVRFPPSTHIAEVLNEPRYKETYIENHARQIIFGDDIGSLNNSHHTAYVYEGLSKSFRTGRLERQLQMVQLSATRCNCITTL
jgi:hypothetical protein